ncbi:probable chaperone protein ClpB 2 [Triticum urartu]|uniref:probable chaperone protein ClpB 2 n=1 Tax=Triticum urartu TaxID=4572 RepID=UPI002043750B|nr:probable chaperone protein ClpB 2 [Triticum urartu]
MTRVWRHVQPVLWLGATTGLCWAVWRYHRYRTCLRSNSRNITEPSADEGNDLVIGRNSEIDRIICILCRRTKNCAALVGEAGVGKTAIVEGLTQRITNGKVPTKLAGACVVEVDLGAMVAETNLCGMFEQRIKDVIRSSEDGDDKVILFIDEMHMLLGARDSVGGTDAANLLKPALARGRIRCVGATTLNEYHKYIQADAALERRFQKVHVEEPSVEVTIAILKGLKQRVWRHVQPVLWLGATTGLCWAVWRYHRYRTCLRSNSRNITEPSADEGNDPVIGRNSEIDRIICILCHRTKNCAALVGEAGVGKTAIVEGLTQRITNGKVPTKLAGACVVEVDLGAMVAETNLCGMFEQRIKDVIRSAEDGDDKVILFIDEMHMLLGARDSVGGTDAANLLKPALARGRIRCVGATTLNEYHKYIQADAALERRFQKVHVEEPSVEVTIAILKGLKQRYQDHHGLEIQDAALVAVAQLAGRYITDRHFPDKAIDLIDEACAATRIMLDSEREATAARTQIYDKKEVTAQSRSMDALKQEIVGPGHVAQVFTHSLN